MRKSKSFLARVRKRMGNPVDAHPDPTQTRRRVREPPRKIPGID